MVVWRVANTSQTAANMDMTFKHYPVDFAYCGHAHSGCAALVREATFTRLKTWLVRRRQYYVAIPSRPANNQGLLSREVTHGSRETPLTILNVIFHYF